MNPYKRLLTLLPQYPVQVGTVASITNGVARIEMPGGGFDSARGTATVGQRVYFRDGQIQGVAPTLPVELIEV